MLRNLEKRETEYMRLQRHKVGIDDFEQLTVIGKGAFGEVKFLFTVSNSVLGCCWSSTLKVAQILLV